MAGISSRAAGSLENKKKYNGYEYNSDFDLNIGEAFFRTHDPQIGRWWQIDPKPTQSESGYVAMGNNPILNYDLLGDILEGTNETSTAREKEIIKNSFQGKEGKSFNKLIKTSGNTFKKIGEKSFNRAVKNFTPEQKALAKGYKDVINSKTTFKVEVVKQNENLSEASQKSTGLNTGKEVNDVGGGGVTTKTGENFFLSVLVMDATKKIPYVDRATETSIEQPSSAGELSSHEILGHALGLATRPNSVNGETLYSIQASNLYLRAQGITSYFAKEHGFGHSLYSSKQAEQIPDYLQ